jgi:translation initiation factor IF-2
MQPRPPIVTILGHVDHGKTTLLDTIRKSRIAVKEHGGITQRIGAYEISTGIKGYKSDKITFIDTPGHEAFSKLRARGATVADIAILIIDAKDSLMPQTVESISHIKAANIPFIVALNKSDLPDANPEKVKNDLLKYEVMVEGKGGQTPVLSISAKNGTGVPELLETILLISADLNLQYNPKSPAQAYVIETKRDKRGVVVSAIIKEGQFKVGQTVYDETSSTKIRSLISDLGKQLQSIEPSTPFELLGFNELPEVGSLITATEQTKKDINEVKGTTKVLTRQDVLATPQQEKKLSLIVKADTQGSLEAITAALLKNDNLEIVLKSVGEVNKSDVFLAKTTKSIIVGFGTNVAADVLDTAKIEKVIIKTYNIIYELLEELEEVSAVMKEKEEQEKYLKGEAKILATFIIEGEKIFGIKVLKGKINLGDEIELYRNNNMIGKSKVVSLKTRAKAIQVVKKDQEAGIIFGPPLDITIGDMIKSIS